MLAPGPRTTGLQSTELLVWDGQAGPWQLHNCNPELASESRRCLFNLWIMGASGPGNVKGGSPLWHTDREVSSKELQVMVFLGN